MRAVRGGEPGAIAGDTRALEFTLDQAADLLGRLLEEYLSGSARGREVAS